MIVLASASAARAALLTGAGVAFETDPARIDEASVKEALQAAGAPPRDIADKLAELKALRISARHPGAMVLGADQILAIDNGILDKPRDLADARAHLGRLRGRSHQLLSAAVIVRDGAPVWRHTASARLTVRPFSDRFLDEYLDTEGPDICDCVGAYRLESRGAQLFSAVEGDYFTVLGLPLVPLLGYLRANGVLTE